MFSKFVLDLTDDDVLTEVSVLLGTSKKQRDDVFPSGIVARQQKHLGWISEDPKSEYFTDGVVDNKKLAEIYDHGALVDRYIEVLSLTSLRNRVPSLFSLIRAQRSGNRVLEYGCGVATHGLACAQLGCEVHEVDISDRMLEYAKKRFERRGLLSRAVFYPGLSGEVIDPAKPWVPTAAAALPRRYFDTIICTDVMEHVPNPMTLLRLLTDCLKAGGILSLEVSKSVNYRKGHLEGAIKIWREQGVRYLEKMYQKRGLYNWQRL